MWGLLASAAACTSPSAGRELADGGIADGGCNPRPVWTAVGDAWHNQGVFVSTRFTRVL